MMASNYIKLPISAMLTFSGKFNDSPEEGGGPKVRPIPNFQAISDFAFVFSVEKPDLSRLVGGGYWPTQGLPFEARLRNASLYALNSSALSVRLQTRSFSDRCRGAHQGTARKVVSLDRKCLGAGC